MPDFPSTLRILGKTFALKPIPDSEFHVNGNAGRMDFSRQIIWLDMAQEDDQIGDTLLHEAIHALDYSLTLDFSEKQTHALACGLYALFADNPDLVRAFLPETPEPEPVTKRQKKH